MENLNLDQIRTDPGTQARARLDADTLNEYCDAIRENDGAWPFPPAVAFYDGAVYWLADGFHRVAAAQRTYLETAPVDVREGTRRDAILFAAGANAEHGLKRSIEDKRNAVRILLNDDEWGQWSDREIARQCKVSHSFVGKIRTELTGHESSDQRTYVNKHGQTAVMNTEKIGGGSPSYVPVWELATVVRQWLHGYCDQTEYTAVLEAIKEKSETGREHWSKLNQSYIPSGRHYRERDLRQACNNVLDHLNQDSERNYPMDYKCPACKERSVEITSIPPLDEYGRGRIEARCKCGFEGVYIATPATPEYTLATSNQYQQVRNGEQPDPDDFNKRLRDQLHSMAGASDRWQKRRQDGLSDDELKTAIGYEFGIGGGSSGPNMTPAYHAGGKNPRYWYNSMGPNGKPALQGKALINAVRDLLEIPFPKSDLDRRLDEIDEVMTAEVAEMLAEPTRLDALKRIQRELESFVIHSEPPMTFAYNRAVQAIDECIQQLEKEMVTA